jgi:Sporulation protein and related proteins
MSKKHIQISLSILTAAAVITAAVWFTAVKPALPIKTGMITVGKIMIEEYDEINESLSKAAMPEEETEQSDGSSESDRSAESSAEQQTPSSKPAKESSKNSANPPTPPPAPQPPSGFADWLSGLQNGADGYVSSITVGGKTMSGQSFRQTLGTNRIRSASFTYRVEGDNFVFTTKGYGHGVGLSQWGAYYYANNDGWSGEQIIKHYFQGVSVASSENVDDDYAYALAQIVDVEMGSRFPTEALKAQAIAAHSYLLYNGQTPTRSGRVVSDKVWQATSSVRNVIATYNGAAIRAHYFASSNGRTRNSKDVWGSSAPYLVSVESKYDHLSSGWQTDCVVAASIVKQQFGL